MSRMSDERNGSLPDLCTTSADLDSANAALQQRRPRYELINATESDFMPSPTAYYADQGKHSYVINAEVVEIDFDMSVEQIRDLLDQAFDKYFATF